jgi:acyl carrier protein
MQELTPTLRLLMKEVAKILAVGEVDPDVALGDIGIDSLNVVELVLTCEQLYPDTLNPEELSVDQHTTLRELDRQLRETASTAV